jgi:hypothetical protein
LQRKRPTPRKPKARSSSRLLELLLSVGEHAVRERLDDVRRQVRILELAEIAVHAHLRRRSHRQVEVRASQVQRRLQQIRKIHRSALLSL